MKRNAIHDIELDSLPELFKDSDDVVFYTHTFHDGLETVLVYCHSLCNERLINEMVLPSLIRIYELTGFSSIEAINEAKSIKLDPVFKLDTLTETIFSGQVAICFPHLESILTMSIENIPNRQTEASNIDVTIRGPKDGLVENIGMNIGLIRKRLPTPSLGLEAYTIGTKSMTKVGLLFMKDKIQPSTLADIRSRLEAIRHSVEQLSSASQLEEIISDKPYSLFPLTVYTGRADFIATCLIKGRFIILIDGVPGAMIAPASLSLLLKTA